MDMNCMANCLKGVSDALTKAGLGVGGIAGTVEQLRTMFAFQAQQTTATVERMVRDTVKLGTGSINIKRDIDVAVEGMIGGVQRMLHIELKTGDINNALKGMSQLKQDAAIAIKQAATNAGSEFTNIWRFTTKQFDAQSEATLLKQMTKLKDQLKSQFNLSDADIK